MKRAEILSKLAGIEKADEIADYILDLNGKDIESAKGKTANYEETIEQLNKQVKDATASAAELADLKKFKEETTQNQIRSQKETAVSAWLKEQKASEKALPLLLKTVDLNKVEIENGKVKDLTQLEPIKTDYADFFETQSEGGATAAKPQSNEQGSVDPFIQGFSKIK